MNLNKNIKQNRVGIGRQFSLAKTPTTFAIINDPIQQLIQIKLDSLYYGYSTHVRSDRFYIEDEPREPTPQYRFSFNKFHEMSIFNMEYVPIPGHDSLVDSIKVVDFARLIRTLNKVGDKICSSYTNTKKSCLPYNLIDERDKIISDFAIMLQYLGHKYRKINRENKDKLRMQTILDKIRKEQANEVAQKAKKDQVEAKEKAKRDKAEAKEKAKKDKAEATEKAKKDKAEAKEKAKKEKMEVKVRNSKKFVK